jgi:tRNA A58 N-methylase Trm61
VAGATPQQHTFAVTWRPNSYTVMTRSKTVTVRAGEPAAVDLTIDDPADRVRVIYVPTPADVAEEMVRLAGVTGDDVVYEPGCGDARITIAAIRAGARRGLCVDIEPERAEESRANVKAAGMQDRIDVRLGDALDVKDLSEVTVVFLYMGDHFNLLIRPVLWRDLKVGSRVVSHRFTMGDWAPDRTILVTSAEGGDFDVHLWTVTEDVKRRLEDR